MSGEFNPVKLVGVIALAVMCLFIPGGLFEHLDAQHVMVIQSPLTGKMAVHTEPGVKWQGFGKVTEYLKRDQYSFEEKDGNVIKVRFNDGGHADVSGGVAWEIPATPAGILNLHSKYGDQNTIEAQLIRTIVEKSVYMTGPLMSSKESSAERRNDLLRYIEDQVQRGVYQTRTEQIKEPDPMTGQQRTVNIVKLVTDDKGVIQRQEASPLAEFGIRVFNLSLNSVKYDDTVEKQIQAQQATMMQVQAAIANAKKAEQDAITAAKNGEAEAAKAKWAQEAIKAQLVTQAEQNLAVATLDTQTAAQQKQTAILQGEGEAARRRAIMQADGALQAKLGTYLEVQKVWAAAFSNYKGNIVPSVSTGGGGTQNGALDFMTLMSAKAAKELAVSVDPKQ